MNWDNLRFVAAAERHGSFLKAAQELGVEHTTVARRVAAAEADLGVTLFARSTTGLALTADGERLLGSLRQVESAFDALERQASAGRGELHGTVRVTAPETFGVAWLAPRLARFASEHPGLQVDLDPSGQVLDLGRQAEIAVRTFRSQQQELVVRRATDIAYGLYAARSYLARQPLRSPLDLVGRPLLTVPPGSVEATWFAQLAEGAAPALICVVTVALVAAARAGAGVAVLPRYLGDAEPELVHLPMPDEPRETLWLTVHRDLRATPRVRAVLDFMVTELERERPTLEGGVARPRPPSSR